MKKFALSLMLVVFLFGAFYPVIYATENIIVNQVEEKIEDQEKNNTVEQEVVNLTETENTVVEKEIENEAENVVIEESVAENITEENIVVQEPVVENIVEENIVENNNVVEVQTVGEVKEETNFSTTQDISNLGASYSGRLCLDIPAPNQTYTLPESNALKIAGWAVSNDRNAVLRLYVNNKQIGVIENRTSRPDVDALISPSYGGTAMTPKAGFETVLDISGYAEGTYEIKVEQESSAEVILSTEIVIIKVAQKKYTGQMYIDAPANNQTCTLPDTSKIALSGWAVSNDEKAVVKLYVNGVYWTDIGRASRPDVTKVYSQYKATTPKAGFVAEVDISLFPEGTHNIRVDQVSRYGKVISTQTVSIKVKQKSYAGQMYIDTPSNNQTCTLPDTSKIALSGWAVSNDEKAVVKLYVNDVYWTDIGRTSRPDVTKVYSQYKETTPKAGFVAEVDISLFPEGTHNIRVDQVSRYGKVISTQAVSIKVKQKSYAGQMHIDAPSNNQNCLLPDANVLSISGWAVSNDANAVLNLYVNDKFVKKIDTRIARKDIDSAISPKFGGTATTPKAGFNTSLDISGYAEGTYKIRIDEVSRYGKVIATDTRTVKVSHKKYAGEIWVDGPANNQTYQVPATKTMQISGWAVANDPQAYILVLIDGQNCSYTVNRNARPDVDSSISPKYGGTAVTPKAGFNLNVQIGNLSEGKHTIDVRVTSRYHQHLSQTKFTINVSTPTYEGAMNIDDPVQNRRYHSGVLEVSGWALTPNQGDYVEVHLDGKLVTYAERVQRLDVLGVYGNAYGGASANPLPGFYSLVSTAGLAEGTHTLKVVHYSSYKKQIQAAEVKFVISNTEVWGIDVSHHNGDIDWNSVKSQGVSFAILKIGEFRESSGRIIQDEHFERNYSECKRLGIAVGGYFYSYAFDPTEASHEAMACLSIIQGKSFEMPIFLDIEDSIVKNAVDSGRTNVENLTNGAVTFCQMMNNSGYQAGVYASKNFFYQYLNRTVLENYNIWLAHYVDSSDYVGRYDMWQYTSDGSLPGISGRVDFNWCFKRYY